MLIRPEGDDKERVYSREIEYVIAKNGTVFIFDIPPVVVNDSIVGVAKVQSVKGALTDKVTIPLADVSKVSLKKTNRPYIVIGVLAGAFLVVAIIGAITVATGGLDLF